LLVHPDKWEIAGGASSSGKILVAWQVTNIGKKTIRFRVRDLGKIRLTDHKGKVHNPDILGVDATKSFQECDYPLIRPEETLHFPFVLLFRREGNGLFSLKIRHNPSGDEGWLITDLREGNYTMVAEYSSVENRSDGGFLLEQEAKFLKSRLMNDYWKGEVRSKPVAITIANR
jgi:hypothetical protein